MDLTTEQGEIRTAEAASVSAAQMGASHRWLDRPIGALFTVNWEFAAWALLLVISAAARFYELGVRAMSHDESLHALYSYYLYDAGNYEHNPMMHGPLLFHVNALLYFLFGDNDTTARIAPALAGIGVVWMAYPYRRYLGRIGALAAGIMLSISPSLLFHSRYIRNDIYIALFVMVWTYGAFRYMEAQPDERRRWLAVMLLGMTPAFIAKENAFMAGAIIGAFFAGLAVWRVIGPRFFIAVAPVLFGGGTAFWLFESGQTAFSLVAAGVGAIVSLALLIAWLRGEAWGRLRNSSAADLAVVMLTLIMPFTAPFGHAALGWDPMAYVTNTDLLRSAGLVLLVTLGSVGIAYYWFGLRSRERFPDGVSWREWLGAMGAFWLTAVLFFTTFLTNTRNGLATGVVGSLGYWLAQQEVARGGQPWYYYFMLSALYEFLPLILAIGGTVLILWRAGGDGRWDPVAAAELPRGVATEAEREPARAELLRVNRVTFAAFGVWWIVGSWAAYTIAGEKMPWLLTHLALPMCVVGGWWFGRLVSGANWSAVRRVGAAWLIALTPALLYLLYRLFRVVPFRDRSVAGVADTMQWIVAALVFTALVYVTVRLARLAGKRNTAILMGMGVTVPLFLLTVRFTYMLNYVNFDMATEYLVYAHGSPDIKRALNELDLISERTAGERNVVVAYDDESSWPMSWYMRLYPNSRFYGNNPTSDVMTAPVVIVGPANYEKVRPYVARDYVKRTYRRIWWPDQGYFNLTWERFIGALRDPARMKRIADIVFYRRYADDTDPSRPRDLTQWPTRSDFEMYVRRDIAAEIWDLGAVPTAASGSGLQALLIEKEVPLNSLALFDAAYDGLPLVRPRAVASGPDGSTVIADSGNHRIVVIGADGQFVRAFGGLCRLGEREAGGCVDPDGEGPLELGDGQFNEPWGVAVDTSGDIYVADTWNGRIQVFDAEGRFLRRWGYFNTTDGELGDPYAMFGPRGLDVDSAGNVLVADTGNKRILRFTPEGESVSQVGGGGVILGRFEEPTSVSVDPASGAVFVADNWNRRIQKLDADLTPLAEWPVPGWQSREIYHKPFVAASANGDVYVTDPESYRVIVYDGSGQLKATFGDYGTEADRFGLPNGIAVDEVAGTILIADADNNRVMVMPLVP